MSEPSMSDMAAPVPKKPKGKSLSWKLPEESDERMDSTVLADMVVAERVSSAVRECISELLPPALRDATAATLQKLSVVTLRMSSLLDRLEVNAGDVSVSGTEVASIQENVGLSPRSMRSLSPNGTLLERRVIDLDRMAESCGISSYAPSRVPSANSSLAPQGEKSEKPSASLDITVVHAMRKERGGDAISTAAKARRAVSVQGWVGGSVYEQEIQLPLPPNTPRRSIDESAGAASGASEVLKSRSPRLERMGMKSLETHLARALFKTAQRPHGKGQSCDENHLCASMSRQSSRGKALGEGLDVVPEPDVRRPGSQAILKRGQSKEKMDGRQPLRLSNFPQAPQAKPPILPAAAVSAPSTPEKEQSTAAEPVNVLLEELPAQEKSTPSAGIPNGLPEEGESPGSQEPRKEANSFGPQDGTQKKGAATNTSRSKKGSSQLRDANNDELIRATIKSVTKIVPTDQFQAAAVGDTLEESSTEEEEQDEEVRPHCGLLQAVGNGVVRVISVLNCSESVCDSYCGRMLFQAVLMLLCMLSLGWIVLMVVLQQYVNLTSDLESFSYYFYDLGFAFGALLCLLCGGCLRRYTPVAECESMLSAFADGRDLHEDWLRHCRWDALLVLVIWILSVGERVREVSVRQELDQQLLINLSCNVASFAVSASILLACLFRVMRVCRGFYVIIDDFSFNLVTTSDLCVAEQDWNLLQALLRRSCHSLQYLFIVLQSTIVAVLIFGVDDFYRLSNLSDLISGGLVCIGLAQLFLCAASVTDHCERLPSFVNSLGFGRQLDQDRLYLVEYMFYSQAGFYIFEVRVTRDMVLKAFYVSGMAIFYFATKVMSGGL